jgi:hypothetical protein
MILGKKMISFFLVLDQLKPDKNDIDPLPMSLIRAKYYIVEDIADEELLWETYYDYVWALDNSPVLERSRQVDKYRRLEPSKNYNYY